MRHGSELKSHVVNTDSQYNLPAQSLNLKNVSARDGLRHYYDDPVVQRMIALDMNILDCYMINHRVCLTEVDDYYAE